MHAKRAFFSSLANAFINTRKVNQRQNVRLQDNFKEAYVRRALRLAARRREAHHQRWFRISLVGMLPLCPLMLSPFPNLPLYYLGYRVYSHSSARNGTREALRLLDAHSTRGRGRLRDAIVQLRSDGVAPREGSWAATLAAQAAAEPAAGGEAAAPAAKLVLEGNSELAALTDPGRKCAPVKFVALACLFQLARQG